MIKLCASPMEKTLLILFRKCFQNACFPKDGRKPTLYLCHYCLFMVKKFEKIIFNSLFKYLEDNNLLNGNQPGFCPGDSYVHQLLSITHEIYKAFDANSSLKLEEYFWIYQKPLIKFVMTF